MLNCLSSSPICYTFFNYYYSIINLYETILTPELVPRRSAPASSIFSAVSLSLMPPDAFTFNPYGETVSYISLTSSAFAPTPFFTNPVDVLTKSALASIHNSQAFLISSFVSKSVSRITFSGLFLQASFTALISLTTKS